jgi:sugar lactone lactonase YvrE
MTTLLNTHTFSSDRAGRSKRFAAIPALAVAFTALLILGCGGGGNSTSSSAPANPTGPAPNTASKTIAVYAGSAGGPGCVDGPANIAHFGAPVGLVFDGQGNLLVADMDAKAIRKVDAATGQTSTWAGSLDREGSFDGYLPDARFASNGYMAKASDGTIYLTDLMLGGVRKIGPDGMVSTLVGCGGGTQWVDGVGPNVQFAQPMGLALDEAKGYLYVADLGHHVIRRVNVATTETITLAGVPRTGWEFDPSTVDGAFEEAQFYYPRVLVGPVEGALYVGCNDTIRKVDLVKRTVTTVAGTPGVQGFADGMGSQVRFNAISGLALDGRGHLLVTEGGYTNNYCGQVLRSLDLASGQVRTLAGTGSEIPDPIWGGGAQGLGGWADGIGGKVRFDMPFDILVDPAKNLGYISDAGNALIRRIDLGTGQVSTLAGTAPRKGATDGKALEEAAFNQPFGLAVDAQGNTYVADCDNQLIRKITPQGVVSTLAGQAGKPGCDNGSAASATFTWPDDVAVDAQGNVFVADTGNSCIRKITPEGIVSIFAGDPENPGWADGPGATAQFFYPQGICVGPDGNIFVADANNDCIRMITPEGTVSTYAGSVRGLVDGIGEEACFYNPYDLAMDASGHLLVADTGNRAIRSIDLATGAVTTLAGGKAVGARDGEGDSAQFAMPVRLVADPRGFLLVGDTYNHAIRKVTPSGTVTTVVGTLKDGEASVEGIKLGDLPGQIKYPSGLAIAPDGSLLALSDNCVLKITGIE